MSLVLKLVLLNGLATHKPWTKPVKGMLTGPIYHHLTGHSHVKTSLSKDSTASNRLLRSKDEVLDCRREEDYQIDEGCSSCATPSVTGTEDYDWAIQPSVLVHSPDTQIHTHMLLRIWISSNYRQHGCRRHLHLGPKSFKPWNLGRTQSEKLQTEVGQGLSISTHLVC